MQVGVYQSEVVYGSPSHEPYPDLARETTTSYTYTGGKDNQVRYVDNQVRDKDHQVRDKDNQVRDKDNLVRDKDNQVRDKNNQVRDKDHQVRDKDNPRLVTKTTRSDMQTAS